MKKHFISIVLIMSLVTASAGAKDIAEYFASLPNQKFTEGTPQQLMAIVRRGDGKSVLDAKNGYFLLEGDGAQVPLQGALFRFKDRSPLIVVAWGALEENNFTNLSLFRESNGKLVSAARNILPVGDSKKHYFELPRQGRTLVVKNQTGAVISRWTWTGEGFQQE